MQGFKEYLIEQQETQISWDAMKHVEKYLDALFNTIGVDVSFTKHFMERVNDFRNKPHITLEELTRLFKLVYAKFGGKIKFMKPQSEAVLKDMQTDINTPVVFKWNPVKRMMEIVAKTVMRKKNFLSPDPTLAVR
jgi:hypothetical protein